MATAVGRDSEDRPKGLGLIVEKAINPDTLKKKFDTSNFGANAVLRGMQLTLVGGM